MLEILINVSEIGINSKLIHTKLEILSRLNLKKEIPVEYVITNY